MKIQLGKFQLRIYASKLEKRTGICSKTYKDKHALLWDFDNGELQSIKEHLRDAQIKYKLPTIYIYESSEDKYHALCFTGRTFREIIHILASVPEVDMNYLKLGIVRGYYTLRITPRANDLFGFRLVNTLVSYYGREIDPLDLTVNDYFTSNKGVKRNAKRE